MPRCSPARVQDSELCHGVAPHRRAVVVRRDKTRLRLKSAVMRRVSNHRFAGRSEPEQGSRRFRVVPTGGDPIVTDKPDKPEQITPAKTVTDTGIAPDTPHG